MNINNFKKFKNYTIEKILFTGDSPVKKYLLLKDSKKYILRLYNQNFISSRLVAFNNIKKLYVNGIHVPKPIEIGSCNDSQYAYMILEWVNGKSIEDLIKSNNEQTAIQFGIKSGQELRKLHSVESYNNPNIFLEYKEKISKKKAKFLSLGLRYDDILFIFDYLEKSRSLLHNNQSSIIHGDIHAGNIILSDDNKQFFIDLDVCKKSASWYDLASNACLLNNNMYYVGLFDGYFNEKIPDTFWEVYTFYGCLHCLDYILYSIRCEKLDLDHGLKILNNFLNSTRGLDNFIPEWYIETKNNYIKSLGGKEYERISKI